MNGMDKIRFEYGLDQRCWIRHMGSSHGHPRGVLEITGDFPKEDLLQEELRLKK